MPRAVARGRRSSPAVLGPTHQRATEKPLRRRAALTTVVLVSFRDFIHVTYGEPHAGRGREILAAHPELRALGGPTPASALWGAAVVSL